MSVPAWNPKAGVDEFHYTSYEKFSSQLYNSGAYRSETSVESLIDGHSARSGIVKGGVTFLAPGTPWRPPTSYNRRVSRVTRKPGLVRWYDGEKTNTETRFCVGGEALLYSVRDWWGSAMSSVAPNDNSRVRADVECRKKIGDQKVNYLVALAEARKTANMLTRNTFGLIRALRAVRNRDYAGAAKELGIPKRHMRNGRALASRHLEFQYGWLPLMGDIHGTFELLKEQINRPLILRATRHIVDSTDIDHSMIAGWGNPYWSFSSVTGSVRRDHSTTLYGQIDDPYLNVAQRMGLSNPLTLGWELIPYSFVVDWALPVGTMLEALSAIHGIKFIGGFRGLHGQLDLQLEGNLAAWRGESGNPGSASYECFSYRRDVLYDWPEVRPYIKSPFTASNAYNALALLRMLFK